MDQRDALRRWLSVLLCWAGWVILTLIPLMFSAEAGAIGFMIVVNVILLGLLLVVVGTVQAAFNVTKSNPLAVIMTVMLGIADHVTGGISQFLGNRQRPVIQDRDLGAAGDLARTGFVLFLLEVAHVVLLVIIGRTLHQ